MYTGAALAHIALVAFTYDFFALVMSIARLPWIFGLDVALMVFNSSSYRAVLDDLDSYV